MMTSFKLVFLFAAVLSLSWAVDRNNFKTCEQSSFCRRLRNYNPGESPYEVLADTVVINKHSIVAEVRNNAANHLFVLQLTALADGTFRVYMDEKTPLYPRYKVQMSLDGEPTLDEIKLVSQDKQSVQATNTQGHKVVLWLDPLKVDFQNAEGKIVATVNGRGRTTIEHLRVKAGSVRQEEEVEGNEQVVEAPVQDGDLGEWEENFKSHHDSKPRGPEGLSLDITFPEVAHVYGIPEHADKLALRTTKSGDPYRLFNLDVFEYELDSTMALYGSVPVMYAHGPSHTVGVFWNNAAETWVDIENAADGTVVSSIVNLVTGGSAASQPRVDVTFMSESGVFDAFVLMGPKPADTFRQYTKLTGTGVLPPLFSLAYHQCRWNYIDEEDVMGVDENFDVHDIPMDVIWLDIEYTDNKKYFTWDPDKFAHPREMISNLTAKGRKLVVIIDPHIKRDAGYFLHEEATSAGHYVKNKDGGDYEGWCWPGSSSYLDFFRPETSAYYSSLYGYDKFPGTSKDVHLWNDMNEPSVFNGPEITMPKDCRHYKPAEAGQEGLSSFWEHRHVHNEYALSNVRATYQGMLERDGGKYRPFILTRGHFPGAQRYAAVWTGDNMAEWGFLQASVPMCLSLAVAGISFCGSDVGGFFKYPEADLMTRWYQAAAYQPFFRAHSHIETKRREPWLYDANTMKLIREALRRRYSHLWLWYTLFYEHSVTGAPVMRPLFMQYPGEKETFAIDNQYLLGDVLLIRPVLEQGVTSVSVYLPGAQSGELWYDSDSYEAHQASGYYTQNVNMAKIPVYQRGNTILAKKERIRRASSLMHDDPFTLIVALSKNNTAYGSLYIDDGETFEYRTGKFIYAKISYEDNTLSYKFPNPIAQYPTRAWLERVVMAGVASPPQTAKLHVDGKQTALQMTYHRGNNVLVVRKPQASMGAEWKIVFNYA